jgi:hypothetical protein
MPRPTRFPWMRRKSSQFYTKKLAHEKDSQKCVLPIIRTRNEELRRENDCANPVIVKGSIIYYLSSFSRNYLDFSVVGAGNNSMYAWGI